MLERLTVRTIAVSLPLLTVGLAAGIVRLREDGGGLDALDGGGARHLARLRGFRRIRATGRRAAHLALVGFALVILARVVLAGSHF